MNVIVPMYPQWVFWIYGAASLGVLGIALVSVGAAFGRRWALVARLGRASFLGGLGILVTVSLMIIVPPALGLVVGFGPESKATRLAKTIAETMNATAVAVPALLIGSVTWALAAFLLRRRG